MKVEEGRAVEGWWAGLEGWDVVIHAFSIVGLGGFSNKDASLGHFANLNVEIVAIVFALLAGLVALTLAAGPELLRLALAAKDEIGVEEAVLIVLGIGTVEPRMTELSDRGNLKLCHWAGTFLST